jgi:hypothetical protein
MPCTHTVEQDQALILTGLLFAYNLKLIGQLLVCNLTHFERRPWFFQDISDVTFIVFHRVLGQRHLLR